MSKKEYIIQLFLDAPEKEFHIRELARKAGVSAMAARKYLLELKNKKLVTERLTKLRAKNYRANLDNPLMKEEIKHSIIKKLFDCGLIDYLNKEFNLPAIFLFGSAAKGEATSTSDLDIFVYTQTRKEPDTERFSKRLGRPLQIFVMNEREFEDLKKKNPHLANAILNGIPLAGFLEVFK